MTPPSRMVTTCEADRPAIATTSRTASRAKTKAAGWGGTPRPRKTIERAAPKAAPLEMPRLNSKTRGFLNSAWSEAPDTASAAPAKRASRSRGSRTRKRMSAYGDGPEPSPPGKTASATVVKNGLRRNAVGADVQGDEREHEGQPDGQNGEDRRPSYLAVHSWQSRMRQSAEKAPSTP